ncbi:MAG: hypothetical protein ACKPHU_29175 [Planctomycetaceae bacterium]
MIESGCLCGRPAAYGFRALAIIAAGTGVSGGQQLHAVQAGAQQVDGLNTPVGVANGVDFLAGAGAGWAKRRVGEAPGGRSSC